MERIISAALVDGKGGVLLLKRSPARKIHPGKWALVSGHIEEGESPKECAEREIREELGKDISFRIEMEGEPFTDIDSECEWLVTPLLCRFLRGKIRLDDEHAEMRWVMPQEIANFDIVPGIIKDIEALGIKTHLDI
ncbi:MAG: NUDIX domain-containing protein [Candidatus Micrarchaeota archaeon]|nr:NUDIX domain-containing protein [Candidatus Micrarchaeota archaeon]